MSTNKTLFNGPEGLVVPRLAADPSTALNGEIYYNTATNKFRVYENGVWGDSVAAGGANTTLSNLGTTEINANLTFSSDLSEYIISTAAIAARNLLIRTGNQAVNSSGTGVLNLITGNSQGTNSWSGNTTLASGTATSAGSGHVVVTSGNADASGPSGNTTVATGTTSGNTGNITIQTGATAATRGKIKLVDGSTATVGFVWTSTNLDGSGTWQAAGGGGANTTLSNLDPTTAVNETLLFDAGKTIRIPNNTGILGRNFLNTLNFSLLSLNDLNEILLGDANISSVLPGNPSFSNLGNQTRPWSTLTLSDTLSFRSVGNSMAISGSSSQSSPNGTNYAKHWRTQNAGAIGIWTDNRNVGSGSVSANEIALATGNNNSTSITQFTWRIRGSTGNLTGSGSTSGQTGGIEWTTGNVTSGAANSGDFTVTTGTVDTGTRGSILFNAPIIRPTTDKTNDLGTSSFRFKDLYLEQGQIEEFTATSFTGYGLSMDQGATSGAFQIATKDHATDSIDTALNMRMFTGSKPGASSTGATGEFYIWTGDNAGSGNSGDTGIYSGNAAVGASGLVYIASGNSTSGNSGDIYLTVGSAGATAGIVDISGASIVDMSNNLGALKVPNLTADPGSFTGNGHIWYNTTSNELKARVNNVTVVLT